MFDFYFGRIIRRILQKKMYHVYTMESLLFWYSQKFLFKCIYLLQLKCLPAKNARHTIIKRKLIFKSILLSAQSLNSVLFDRKLFENYLLELLCELEICYLYIKLVCNIQFLKYACKTSAISLFDIFMMKSFFGYLVLLWIVRIYFRDHISKLNTNFTVKIYIISAIFVTYKCV